MNKSRDNDRARLGDMLVAARVAAGLIAGETRDMVAGNLQLYLALRYVVQIIGEAANQLTDELKNEHDHIPWAKIIGMRHRLVHDYNAVDFNVVWDTAIDSLPPLIADLEHILEADTS